MDVQSHKESFEKIYKNLSEGDSTIVFPLDDIEKMDFGPAKELTKNYYCYMYRRFSCHILNELNLKDDLTILVLGCGQGLDEKNIKNLHPSVRIKSVDISIEMIRRAIDSASPSTFALASAESMPFPDKSFDRIVSREVIEHVANPQQMLNEVSRMLRDDGVAIITTENEESLSRAHAGGEFIKKIIRFFFRMNKDLDSTEYKDDAPTLIEMKSFIEKTDLELCDCFFDGALYHSLPLLHRWFKGCRLAALAHKLSALEANRVFAPLFCDQVKFVLKKRIECHADVIKNSPDYVCPVCQGKLELSVDKYQCSSHGSYHIDRVPDFILVDDNKIKTHNDNLFKSDRDSHSFVEIGFLGRVGRYVERRVLYIYSHVLILCGCLIVMFLPKNPKNGSKRIDKNNDLFDYIRL